MTEAVVQFKIFGKDKFSIPTKYYFPMGGSREYGGGKGVTLGDLEIILRHSISPHVIEVIQAAKSPVILRTDDEPIKVLRPDGGHETLFEHTDSAGTVWHVYHATGPSGKDLPK